MVKPVSPAGARPTLESMMLRNNVEKSLEKSDVKPGERLDMSAPQWTPPDPNAPPPPPLTPEQKKAAEAKLAQMHKALGNVLGTMHRTEMGAIRSIGDRPTPESIARKQLETVQQAPGWQQLSGAEREGFEQTLKSRGQEGFAARKDMDALRARGFEQMSPDQQAQALRDVYNPPSAYVTEQVKGSEAFQKLAPGDRKNLEIGLKQRGPDGLAPTVRDMMATDGWKELSPDERAGHLKDLTRRSLGVEDRAGVFGTREILKGDPANVVADAEKLKGFSELNEDEQRRTRALLGGEHNPISPSARERYAMLKNDPVFRVGSAEEQAARLRELPEQTMQSHQLASGGHAGHARETEHADEARPYQLSAPHAVEVTDAHGQRWKGELHKVWIGEHSVDVMIPNHNMSADPLPTAEQVAQGLARADPRSVKALERVIVHPYDSPDDAAKASALGYPGFKSAMTVEGRDPGRVNIYPAASDKPEQMSETLNHELGHTLSFQQWGATPQRFNRSGGAWDQYRKAVERDGMAVSQYGESRIVEDAAEAWTLYSGSRGTPAHDELREIYPNRFEMLDMLDKGQVPEREGFFKRLFG